MTRWRTDVTALSVFFGGESLLYLNGQLSDSMNRGLPFRWIAVDNGNNVQPNLLDRSRFDIVTGPPDIPFEISRDRGSLHHSQGLMLGKQHVTTRFLVIIDPDFYVVWDDWMTEVLTHMEKEGLSLFGSCWHPRWHYQYRGFPTVHFMVVDLHRLALRDLDFTPGIRSAWLYHAIARSNRLPLSLRCWLLMGRFKDTGYRIREKVLRDGGHRYGTLVPHYIPEYSESFLGRLLRRYPRLIPDRFSRNPTRKGAITEKSFLRTLAPDGYRLGWEEFYWKDQPFGFHLRNIGRGTPTGADHPELLQLLATNGPFTSPRST